MKKKIEELENAHFYFDLTLMTRALVGVVCKRALFEQIHSRKKEELISGWEQLSTILDYLVNILPHQAYIHSTEDMATTNALIPVIVYLSLYKNKFPNETPVKHAIHWFYAAQMWARYTSQTDQRLEQDISIILREQDSPWDSLCNQIIDQRGRLEVKADDMEGRGIQHPIYKMAFILAKAQSAVDWDSGVVRFVLLGGILTLIRALRDEADGGLKGYGPRNQPRVSLADHGKGPARFPCLSVAGCHVSSRGGTLVAARTLNVPSPGG